MKVFVTAAALAVAAATQATGQGTTTAIIVPPGGAADFCYFDGLAYSKNAVITIDVTNRRESPQAVQKAMLECSAEEGSPNLAWSRIADE